MSRLPALDVEDWDPELRELVNPDDLEPLQSRQVAVLAHAPHMVKANGLFMATSMHALRLPRRLVELVRLRIAFHNQCRTCMVMRDQAALDDGLTDDLVCSLEKPVEAPDLTEREKLALEYADLFATNHFAIDQEVYDRLGQHFTKAEIIELGVLTGYFLGFGRLLSSLDFVEVLPESYQDKSEPIGPWMAQDSVVVKFA